MAGVYPRTHGETKLGVGSTTGDGGLSPYTRGNLLYRFIYRGPIGSIPVHTGKPNPAYTSQDCSTVYPRTHGETFLLCKSSGFLQGLSPYTRGNPSRHFFNGISRGSIPVHTGKPLPIRGKGLGERVYPRTHGETPCDAGSCEICKVYPRTHGETSTPWRPRCAILGLSPYTRGNPPDWPSSATSPGSIPVHTGKPVQTYTYYAP